MWEVSESCSGSTRKPSRCHGSWEGSGCWQEVRSVQVEKGGVDHVAVVYGRVLSSKTARSREGVQLPSKKNKDPCASCPRFLCDLKRTEQLRWSQDQDKDASGLRWSGEGSGCQGPPLAHPDVWLLIMLAAVPCKHS